MLSESVLLDRALEDIAAALKYRLPWMDAAYGRAERIKSRQGDRVYYTPAVYAGTPGRENDYQSLLPDSGLGNFSFFIIDTQEATPAGPRMIRCPYSLVVWLDLRNIYGDKTTRDIELPKLQVLKVLEGCISWRPEGGVRLTTDRIYDRADNIYRGYSLDEVDNQYLIHPYGGFRIEGTLEYSAGCTISRY